MALIGGWPAFLWGYVVSTVVLYHCTFAINSLAHLWGTRRFDTPDESRNNWWLALITFGEGWHNNHHFSPGSCRQGERWWELDITYLVLKTLSWFGIARDLRPFRGTPAPDSGCPGQGGDVKRIAVIGSGISGLSAAYYLSRRHEVHVFERDNRLGGHTHTVMVESDRGPIPVDTGFIVHNDRTYPNFCRLMAELGVETQPSDMSFAVTGANGAFEYSSRGLGGFFAQKRNCFSPDHYTLLREILRFNREAPKLLDDPDARRHDAGRVSRRREVLAGLRGSLSDPDGGRRLVHGARSDADVSRC